MLARYSADSSMKQRCILPAMASSLQLMVHAHKDSVRMHDRVAVTQYDA